MTPAIYRRSGIAVSATPEEVGQLPAFSGSWLIMAKTQSETTFSAFIGPYKETPRTWTIPKNEEITFVIPGAQNVVLQANATDSSISGSTEIDFTAVPVEEHFQWANPGWYIGNTTFTLAGNKSIVDDNGLNPYANKLAIFVNSSNTSSSVTCDVMVSFNYQTLTKTAYLGTIDLATKSTVQVFNVPFSALTDVQLVAAGTFGGGENVYAIAWGYNSNGK